MSNNQLAYICDRIQKITEAVYRVTELFPDREPMKWEIREKSVSIFSVLVSIKNGNVLEKNSKFERIENAINQLLALLSLLSKSNSISSANFDILSDEYELVKKVILKLKQKQNLIKFDLGGENNILPAPTTKNSTKGHSNGQRKSIGQDIGQVKTNKLVVNKQEKNLPRLTRVKAGKGKDRKNKILSIIKDKKEVSIGELSSMISECSEKTIQRDLLDMINQGIVAKEGDKRWRRYMLVS